LEIETPGLYTYMDKYDKKIITENEDIKKEILIDFD